MKLINNITRDIRGSVTAAFARRQLFNRGLRSLMRDRRGASSAEYALLLALLGGSAAMAMVSVATSISAAITGSADMVENGPGIDSAGVSSSTGGSTTSSSSTSSGGSSTGGATSTSGGNSNASSGNSNASSGNANASSGGSNASSGSANGSKGGSNASGGR